MDKLVVFLAVAITVCSFLGSSVDGGDVPVGLWDVSANTKYIDARHDIKRRNIPVSSNAPTGSVTEMDFHLYKVGKYENVTTVTVGEKVTFEFVAHFPPDAENKLLVEIFAPDNDTTVMVLCDVNVYMNSGSILSLLGGASNTPEPVYEEKEETENGDCKFDRVILDFGTVTASALAGDHDDQISVTFDAIVIANADTINGTKYYVSVGAEYNNETEVFIAQAEFDVLTDIGTPSTSPTFVIDGPTTAPIGSSVSYTVSAYLPFPSEFYSFDAFSPLNVSGVMSVCTINVIETGDCFKCLDKERLKFRTFEAEDGKGNEYARLELGVVTNSRAWETDVVEADSLIKFEVIYYIFEDDANVGEDFWAGFAIEVGTEQIWAGQIQLTLEAQAPLTSQSLLPTVTATLPTPTDNGLIVGQPVAVDFDVVIPVDAEYDYRLRAVMPYGTGKMKICRLRFVTGGRNVPCIGDNDAVYTHAVSLDEEIPDTAELDIGWVVNRDRVDVTKVTNASTQYFEIIAEILDTPVSTSLDEVITLFYKDDVEQNIPLTQNLGVVQDASTLNDSLPAPKFTMAIHENRTDTLHIGESTLVVFNITFEPGVVYTPATTEIITEFNNDTNTAVVSICKVEIMFVGSGMPCFDREKRNASIELTSRSVDEVMDRAVIPIGPVIACNKRHDDPDEACTIMIYAYVQMRDSDPFTEGDTTWVSAGMMYFQSKIWCGQLALTKTITPPIPAVDPYAPAPIRVDHVMSGINDDEANIGYGVTYQILFKIPPSESTTVKVEVDASSGDFVVCYVRVLEAGSSLPCVNTSAEPVYTPPEGGPKTAAQLDLQTVTNVHPWYELWANDTHDNNSLWIEVATQLSNDAVAGSTVTFNIKRTWRDSSGSEQVDDLPISLTALTPAVQPLPTNASDDTWPDVLLFTVEPGSEITSYDDVVSFAKGQTRIFRLKVKPKVKGDYSIVVKYLAPIEESGKLEMCRMKLVHIGRNFPCYPKAEFVDKEELIQRTGSTYNDIASFDIGVTCFYPDLYNETDDSDIVFEGSVKAMEEGEYVLSTTVFLNGNQIYVVQKNISVAPTDTFADSINNTVACEMEVTVDTVGPIVMEPGTEKNISFTVFIPCNTTAPAAIDVKAPGNQSAGLTLHGVHLSQSGQNLGCIMCHATEEYIPADTSTEQTTQIDHTALNLLLITNTGATCRDDSALCNDTAASSFSFDVMTMMADALENEDGADIWLSVAVQFGPVITIVDVQVEVNHQAADKPVLILTAETLDPLTPFQNDDDITVNGTLRHDLGDDALLNSRAECYNLSVCFYTPPSILTHAQQTNYISGNTLYESATGDMYVVDRGLCMLYPVFYFTDEVQFNLTFRVNPDVPLPENLSPLQDIVTPYEAHCQAIHRTGSNYPEGTVFPTSLESLEWNIQIPAAAGCTEVPLGMGSEKIQNCQIKASGFVNYDGYNARLNGQSYWQSPCRPLVTYPKYLSVNFGNMTRVTRIELAHSIIPADIAHITAFQLHYSDDGFAWTAFGTPYTLPNSWTAESVVVSPTKEARWIRLQVTAQSDTNWELSVGLQVEFHGCTKSGDISETDVCPPSPIVSPSTIPVSPRVYLVTASTMYFCDRTPSTGKKECFRSQDDGASWTVLEAVVSTLLGCTIELGELYGVSQSGLAYMMSDDMGDEWYSIPLSRYTEMSARPDFMGAMPVSDRCEAGVMDPATVVPDASYDIEVETKRWAATYQGLMFYDTAWEKRVDWTTCCTP